MAKAGELNGYPGPRHVLDASNSEELNLTERQNQQIIELYEEMQFEAIELGRQIVDLEKEINDAFADKSISEKVLQEKANKSAKLYGQLRFVHLKYHLYMLDILTPNQVKPYNELRGYTSDSEPCVNVPDGHDPELWMLHNSYQG